MSSFELIVAWAGILGFLLAIPLSILGNLLTPKVKEWWATTSSARKQSRIKYLKARLLAFPDLMSPEERQEETIRGLWQLAIAGLAFLHAFLLTSVVVLKILVIITNTDVSISVMDRLTNQLANSLTFRDLSFFVLILTGGLGLVSVSFLDRALTNFRNASLDFLRRMQKDTETELKKLCG